jgi:hypothetical protein
MLYVVVFHLPLYGGSGTGALDCLIFFFKKMLPLLAPPDTSARGGLAALYGYTKIITEVYCIV